MNRTRVSSKGQLVLPKSVRDRQGWTAGTELEVEDRGDVVVLRRVRPAFPPTTIGQVRGSARYRGPKVPAEDFDKGIAEHVRETWEGFERQSR
jgi:AbrB family looped-hinge helix DNA binding protein